MSAVAGSRVGDVPCRDALRDVLDALAEVVALLTGPEGVLVFANTACRAILGDAGLEGRTAADVWDGIDGRVAQAAADVYRTGQEARIEGVALRHDDTGALFSLRLRPMEFEGETAVMLEAGETTATAASCARAERQAATLSEVFSRMGGGFYSLDRDWRFTYLNDEAARLSERPKDELLGRVFWEAFPDTVDTKFSEEFQKAMREQTAVSFQEYYPPLDMWASVQAFPSPTGLSVFVSDITSLKEREAALGKSEGQLSAVIDNSPNVIIMKDLSGAYIRVNEEFARSVRLSKEELVGRTDYDIEPKEVADEIAAHDREVVATETPHQYDEDVVAPDGHHVRLLTTRFPLKDASGRVYGIASISVDITGRAEQERALRVSEERFRKVFEEGPAGIVLAETDALRVVQANDTYARMLGLAKEDLLQRTLLDITAPEDRPKTRQLVDLVLNGEIPFYRWDKRYLRADGSQLWVAVTGSLIRDEQGRPSFFLGMVEDITQRKQAEATLRDKDLAIRKAYTDVIGAVTGGKLILVTPEEMRELLGLVISCDWAATQYSVLSEMRHSLSEVLRKQGMPDEDVEGYVLATGEAATNAVKHGGGGRLCVRRTEVGLQIEVIDHGPGIDFEDLPKATLVPGFSTEQSLGMGFTIMLEVCDRLLLTTQPGFTSLVLEKLL